MSHHGSSHSNRRNSQFNHPADASLYPLQRLNSRRSSQLVKSISHYLHGAFEFPTEGLSEDQERSLKTTFEEIIRHIPLVNPHLCLSHCTGRKRAVCIGINYFGQKKELKGCINDALHMRQYLIQFHGFHPKEMFILTDDAHDPGLIPTKRNILIAMKWLVQGAKMHDSLFFHYSGHGGQLPDPTNQEPDGMNEVIFPVDFQQKGEIIDDEMHKIMVQPLPPGCRLTALFDCCHSGTVLDLPFMHSSHGRIRKGGVSRRSKLHESSPADVISLSACKDNQTSSDTFKGGVAVGAMSWALIKTMKANHNLTYGELLRDVRHLLYRQYSQKPQIGSSHPINLRQKFII